MKKATFDTEQKEIFDKYKITEQKVQLNIFDHFAILKHFATTGLTTASAI